MQNPFELKPYLFPRGAAGLACDAEGVALGPVTLVEKSNATPGERYRLCPPTVFAKAFITAYGKPPLDMLMYLWEGIGRVTKSLEEGDVTLAMMKAIHLKFPEIEPDNMAKLAAVELAKAGYNPDEPRDERGRWTSDGAASDRVAGDGSVGVIKPHSKSSYQTPPKIAPAKTNGVTVSDVYKPSEAGQILGQKSNNLINLSPTLMGGLKNLDKENWSLQIGEAGQGTRTDRGNKLIIIDPSYLGYSNYNVASLAHEVGHAQFVLAEDWSTRDNFIQSHLNDEGAAVMENIRVQREIIANGGPDIGIAGNHANYNKYNAYYDQYLKDNNAANAREKIGQIYGKEEHTSGPGSPTYENYYGKSYDDQVSH